LYRSWRRWA